MHCFLEQIQGLRKTVIHQRMGILHPGAMGISLAASAQNSGCTVAWASAGRGSQTAARAARFDLLDLKQLPTLCHESSILVSVCPPHAAIDVAAKAIESKFGGLYVDANAISPEKTRQIGRMMSEAGASFVDGGIIGMPAWEPNATWLYLSGDRASEVAACFRSGPLATEILGTKIGQASALKMCFAAFTKGRAALLCAILATAEALGVREALFKQWQRNGSELAEQATARILTAAPKAWRFEGEMQEIARTFQDAGMPGGFHQAAATIYSLLTEFKDRGESLTLEEVLEALVSDRPSRSSKVPIEDHGSRRPAGATKDGLL